jgi:hypothetical protein
LKAEALEVKDDVIEKAKATIISTVHRITDDLKAKAAVNPDAALAIGAGLGWRLIHRPPIATFLVCAGLFSLLAAPIAPMGIRHRKLQDHLLFLICSTVRQSAADLPVVERAGAEGGRSGGNGTAPIKF